VISKDITTKERRPSSKSAYMSNEVEVDLLQLVGLVEPLQSTVEPVVFDLDERRVIVTKETRNSIQSVSGHMPHSSVPQLQ
jgi:hypothetical protein